MAEYSGLTGRKGTALRSVTRVLWFWVASHTVGEEQGEDCPGWPGPWVGVGESAEHSFPSFSQGPQSLVTKTGVVFRQAPGKASWRLTQNKTTPSRQAQPSLGWNLAVARKE